jgi:tetratricopeptide (TPR) repeat protein
MPDLSAARGRQSTPVFIVPRWGIRLMPMSRRFHLFLVGAILAAVAASAASAVAQSGGMIEPPSSLPRAQRGDKAQNLDRLFEALKVAPDEESAKYIENRIWAIWLASGSDTANLLMGRVKTAMDGKDFELAIRLLNAIIDMRPDYIEAWNRRATIFYMKKDFSRAIGDIREVLSREPRHFGALAGLGIILQEFGDDKRALDAFRRALAIHPHLERVPDMVKRLSDKIDGREI